MGLAEDNYSLPAKEQLRIIFAAEAQRLFSKIEKSSLSMEELNRAVNIARGLKEVELIPSPRKVDKEIASMSTEDLLSDISQEKS